MKLHEIFEEYHTSATGEDPVPVKQDIKISSSMIGDGTQAKVYQHPKNPNAVIKLASIAGDPKTDPYVKFIKIALAHQDNPFFPRIYSAKMYASNDEKWWQNIGNFNTLVVTMEKLHQITKNNKKLHDVVLDNFQLQGVDILNVYDLYDYFKSRSKRLLLARHTKNPKLREALRLLEPILKDEQNTVDMHYNNWMMRLTGVGPQLVIVDPVIRF